MTRMMQTRVRGLGLVRGVALLLALGAIAGCGSQTIRFERSATSEVAAIGSSQLERFRIYYQDNYWNGPSPSAVLLDADDDVAFEGERWSRAQGGSGPGLLSRALDAGYMATELRAPDGILLGYLVATERWYGRRRNRYQLVVAQTDRYDVVTSQFTHAVGGGR